MAAAGPTGGRRGRGGPPPTTAFGPGWPPSSLLFSRATTTVFQSSAFRPPAALVGLFFSVGEADGFFPSPGPESASGGSISRRDGIRFFFHQPRPPLPSAARFFRFSHRRRPPRLRRRRRPRAPVLSSAASIPSPDGARPPSILRRRRPSSWSRGNPSPPPGFSSSRPRRPSSIGSPLRFLPSARRPAVPAFPSGRRSSSIQAASISPPRRSVSIASATAAVVQRDPVPVFPSTAAAQLLPFHSGGGPPRSPRLRRPSIGAPPVSPSARRPQFRGFHPGGGLLDLGRQLDLPGSAGRRAVRHPRLPWCGAPPPPRSPDPAGSPPIRRPLHPATGSLAPASVLRSGRPPPATVRRRSAGGVVSAVAVVGVSVFSDERRTSPLLRLSLLPSLPLSLVAVRKLYRSDSRHLGEVPLSVLRLSGSLQLL
jgi:hypothetical protein